MPVANSSTKYWGAERLHEQDHAVGAQVVAALGTRLARNTGPAPAVSGRALQQQRLAQPRPGNVAGCGDVTGRAASPLAGNAAPTRGVFALTISLRLCTRVVHTAADLESAGLNHGRHAGILAQL